MDTMTVILRTSWYRNLVQAIDEANNFILRRESSWMIQFQVVLRQYHAPDGDENEYCIVCLVEVPAPEAEP